MDLNKLTSNDPDVVQKYVRKKFNKFNRFYYPKSTRFRKCCEYFAACGGEDRGGIVVKQIYEQIFGELFDVEDVAVELSKSTSPQKHKIEVGQWIEGKKERLEKLRGTLEKLESWKEQNRHQEGESFFSSLEETVAYVDESVVDAFSFSSEFLARCRSSVTSDVRSEPDELAAEIELMVGFTQSMACGFEADVRDWGRINAILEQSFKAGVWGEGSAGATMSKLGIGAEAQAAIAMGAQLNVAGKLTWQRGEMGLAVAGNGEAFLGARANASAKLSADAINGLEAAIALDAFVGFSAEVSGSCTFAYEGRTLVQAGAKAGVTFGAGASFKARIKAPIFGPTEIAVAAQLSAGFGASSGVDVEVNFNELSLAASQEFYSLVHWRTMARGYEMTLMNSDARNLYYLNKSILRVKAEVQAVEETIGSIRKMPAERVPLLMSVS